MITSQIAVFHIMLSIDLFVLYNFPTYFSYSGDETFLTGLSESWHYSFGLHFREPQCSLPRMDSTRVFVLFLWLYTMILTIAYSTNLTAFLLVQKPPASIQTIAEIFDSGLEVAGIGAPLNGTKEVSNYTYKVLNI